MVRTQGWSLNITEDRQIIFARISWYDLIMEDREQWSYEGDDMLHARSALEFVRDQLSHDQRSRLDIADAFWRAHPKEFNDFFEYEHVRKDRAIEMQLQQFNVVDNAGATLALPRQHWWWNSLSIDDLP